VHPSGTLPAAGRQSTTYVDPRLNRARPVGPDARDAALRSGVTAAAAPVPLVRERAALQ
jgi:hypothetical protein